jgi:hypothetical protein
VQSLDTDDPKRPFCLENQGSLVGTHLATRGPNEAPEEEEWWSCAMLANAEMRPRPNV